MKRIILRVLVLILQISLALCLCADEAADLFDLVKDGTPEAVREAICAGADFNIQDKDGLTALMIMVLSSLNRVREEGVCLLLEAGADAKLKDYEGKTAWDYAQGNERLKGTEAYEKLREATIE